MNVKLSDFQLNKLKSTVKNQTGAALRMNISRRAVIMKKILSIARKKKKKEKT